MGRYSDFTAQGASASPGGLAIVSDEGTRTFAELDDRAERLAAALRHEGFAPGERLAWLGANELEFTEIQSACLKGGYTFVPLNWRLSVDELRYIVEDAEPSVFVHGRGEQSRSRAVLEGQAAQLVLGLGPDGSFEQLVNTTAPDGAANPDDPELLATLLYTSGTTGRPKGAMIDRLALTSRLLTTVVETRATRFDTFLCALPMFHIAAYMAYAYLLRGATIVQSSVAFEPANVLRVMAEQKVTALLAVPTMMGQLVEEVERNGAPEGIALRRVIYGGSAAAPAMLERAVGIFGCEFHGQYGLTETQMLGGLQPEEHDVNDAGALASVGRPAIGASVRIVDEPGRDVAAGEVGEIICRGPSLMRGYWRNPDATTKALRDGWMHTGDLGYFDKAGRIHVVDRIDDMIVTGGENVYPTEVEHLLMELPAVREVAVIGLPDERWGQVVVGVVLSDAPPHEELEAHLRARIAGYKVPRRWVRLDALPKNATGKILRRALKQQLAETEASASA